MRARKGVGCVALLVYLTLYIMAAASLGGVVSIHAPPALLLAYYAVAGIVWVAPLKPLFAWMNGAGKQARQPKPGDRSRR